MDKWTDASCGEEAESVCAAGGWPVSMTGRRPHLRHNKVSKTILRRRHASRAG